jgi:gluconokinase
MKNRNTKQPPRIIVVMGVSGSGKTTVGRKLAETLGWAFYDGDDFHPAANIAKMAAGQPLADADRVPWLDAIREQAQRTLDAGRSAVIACSALKRAYRQRLKDVDGELSFVYLQGSYDQILARMQSRRHFMPPDLLRSQFEALEEPADAFTVSIEQPVTEIVRQIADRFGYHLR